jgi:hypothetical protein
VIRLRLPILSEPPEEDPLALLRGGRFARWFMASLAAVGLAWVISARVEARTVDAVLVHSALTNLATPPPPPVEDITPQRAPPPPPVEDITPPRLGDDKAVTEDRFGRKRTGTGALVLSEEGEGGEAQLGLSDKQLGEIKTGGFFDPNAFDDVKTVKKKAYVHLMPGIPNEAFFAGVVVILLVSFTVFEREAHGDRATTGSSS